MSEATLLQDNPAAPPVPAASPPVAQESAADPAATPPTPAADPAGTGAPDWRQLLAGEDADELKQLERFSDPKSMLKAFKDTQTALRNKTEGMIKPLGENPTDEEKQAFAKALGIPEAPDKYERVKPPEGLDLAEGDQAFIDKGIVKLHEMGGFAAHPEVAKAFQSFYYEAMNERASQMSAMALVKAKESEQILRKEWGSEYDLNIGLANEALKTLGGKEAVDLLNEQFADGTTLGSKPAIIKLLANAARNSTEDLNFLKTLVTQPSVGAEALQSELDTIKKWRSGSSSEQSRYAEASKPGGRMEQVMEMLNRVSART